jgi:tetratricopeptide (TPR) repeat protein
MLLDALLLKRRRMECGLSQEALIERCADRGLSLSIASLKRAEAGRQVAYRTARLLACALDIELSALLATAAAAPVQRIGGGADAGPADAATGPLYLIVDFGTGDPGSVDAAARCVERHGADLRIAAGNAWRVAFDASGPRRLQAERGLRCAAALSQVLSNCSSCVLLMGFEPDRPLPAFVHDDGTGPVVLVAAELADELGDRFNFDEVPGSSTSCKRLLAVDETMPKPLWPLAGRHSECRQFRAALAGFIARPAAHVLHLRARAGMGKTRLAQHFAELAARCDVHPHWIRMVEAASDDLIGPWQVFIHQLLDLNPAPGGAAVDVRLASLGLSDASRSSCRALLGVAQPPGELASFRAMTHEARQGAVTDALSEFLLACAQSRPRLILIEDLHLVTGELQDALARLIQRTHEVAILWLFTSRTEEDRFDRVMRPSFADVPVSVLDLAALRPTEAQDLADQFEVGDLARRQRCIVRARGNPLFLTQMLMHPDEELPPSLRRLVHRRFELLVEPQRRALEIASVLGQVASLKTLRAILDDPTFAPGERVVPEFLLRVGDERFEFTHDLLRECVYASIESGRRVQLHAMLSSHFRIEDIGLSARHALLARDPAAADLLIEAAGRCMARYEYAGALAIADPCMNLVLDAAQRARLHMVRGHAQFALGQTAAARRSFQQAVDQAEHPSQRIEAAIHLCRTLNVLDAFEEEQAVLDRFIELARVLDDAGQLASLLHLQGNLHFPHGNFAESRRCHEIALRQALASGQLELEARALSGLGDALYAQGAMRQAHETFDECLALAVEHCMPDVEAANLSASASTRIFLGHGESAVAECRRAIGIARKIGNRRAEVVARMTAAWGLVDLGETLQAQGEVDAGLEIARTIGALRFEPAFLESQARIHWDEGRPDRARQSIRKAVECVESRGLHRYFGPWTLGTLALFTDDIAEQQAALNRGQMLLGQPTLAHNALRFLVSAAEIALVSGDRDAAWSWVDRLAQMEGHPPCSWVSYHVHLLRARCRQVTGPFDLPAAMSMGTGALQAGRAAFARSTPLLLTPVPAGSRALAGD